MSSPPKKPSRSEKIKQVKERIKDEKPNWQTTFNWQSGRLDFKSLKHKGYSFVKFSPLFASIIAPLSTLLDIPGLCVSYLPFYV